MQWIKGTFDTVAPHLHLEPGCLGGLTWLQKGQAAPLAGCQKEIETYRIHPAIKTTITVIFFSMSGSKQRRNSYLGGFHVTVHI